MKNYMVCFGHLNDQGDVYSKGSSFQDIILWPKTVGTVVNWPVIRGLTPGQQGGCYVDSENSDIWIVVSYKDCLKKDSYTEVNSCEVEYISYRNSPTNVTQWLKEQGVTIPIYRGFINLIVGRPSYAEVGNNGTCFVSEGIAVAGSDGSAIAGYGIAKTGPSGEARVNYGPGIAIGGPNAKVYATTSGGIALGQGSAKCYSGDYGFSKTSEGEAIAGHGGIALAMHRTGAVQAGQDGLLIAQTIDTYQVARVGEKGIKSNMLYHADSWGFYDPKNKPPHFLRVLRYHWNKLVSFFLI